MKKTRKVKVVLKTREILVAGGGTQNTYADDSDMQEQICPLCRSALPQGLTTAQLLLERNNDAFEMNREHLCRQIEKEKE